MSSRRAGGARRNQLARTSHSIDLWDEVFESEADRPGVLPSAAEAASIAATIPGCAGVPPDRPGLTTLTLVSFAFGALEPHENEHPRNEHHNTNGNKNVDAHHDSLRGP